MMPLQTPRLRLRQLTLDDAAFILELVNEPTWLRYIGDKNVHDLDDARRYLREGPIGSYQRLGFGLYCVELPADSTPIGLCGLIKRDTLPDVDIGFALRPAYFGQGYIPEAARAVIEQGRSEFGLQRLLAITQPDNQASIAVLLKLGMKPEGSVSLAEAAPILLFAIDL
ncbi:MAG: Ribosomal-protein-alanine acetyltransferase [Hydrocarboniphaga sp.]|uniref:GNAT family N-acetyltransferase n=1 Tax=Hydrocarboniphaga sp. TaxID=2033016 RepID=UPI002633DF7E|nr:GNAT family N-acetyltransferase [Hydrocarboniphaga sp.]MDB5969750.1 Ribosomal-protein-alanine acetyltransferase [Hydrocarboniphaga sp.]